MAKLENKRLRKDKADLEADLFRLFERQESWSFVALQNETRQPAAWLKEVLSEVRAHGLDAAGGWAQQGIHRQWISCKARLGWDQF